MDPGTSVKFSFKASGVNKVFILFGFNLLTLQAIFLSICLSKILRRVKARSARQVTNVTVHIAPRLFLFPKNQSIFGDPEVQDDEVLGFGVFLKYCFWEYILRYRE